MAPLKFVDNWITYWLLCYLVTAMAVSCYGASNQSSVKKALPDHSAPDVVAIEAGQLNEHAVGPDGGLSPVIVISERTFTELEAAAKAKNETVVPKKVDSSKKAEQPQQEHKAETPEDPWNNVVEETKYKLKKAYPDDEEIPESFKLGFYMFLGLSTIAVLFIVVKLYRMRLSRAERKYGVQGDRTTQELTPLPVSIEDVNSDDEDQTLFEINRQQIRIL